MFIATLTKALENGESFTMSSADVTPIRVFIVHRHRTIMWGLERLVESAGSAMRVSGRAHTLPEAETLVTNGEHDVVLMEIGACEATGLEALQKFTQNSEAKVLVFASSSDKGRCEQAVLMGARGVVEVEGAPDTVLTAIRKVHEGEIWLDRTAAARVFVEFTRKLTAQSSDPEHRKIASLTDRERQIIAVAAENAGATAKVIAEQLFVSENTIRNHLNSIYEKLGVGNRVELYAYAQAHGLAKRR